MAQPLYTIGHSTRSIDELIVLLRENGVALLIDVRQFPSSRRHPQFNQTPLAQSLEEAGIAYRHEVALGGRRPVQAHSPNTGWREPGFQGYADYMLTDAFQQALDRLIEDSQTQRTAVMCAEAVPWRCHRQLIADAVTVRGFEVLHILSAGVCKPHQLTDFAEVESPARIVYPPPQGQLELDEPPRDS